MNTVKFSLIGKISSCYKEKFGIPRQSGLVNSAPASLHLNNQFTEESVRGLEGFSHLWISFVFHENNSASEKPWKQMVRPPRLGGNKKVGVFASRSPFRPNPLGLSVVEIDRIELQGKAVIIHVLGCDLLDGTPVLDIKPYLPYVDNIPHAKGGFAPEKQKVLLSVIYSLEAKLQVTLAQERLAQNVALIIEQVLQLDPRPSYKLQEVSDRIYSMKLFDFDLKWQYCENGQVLVNALILS